MLKTIPALVDFIRFYYQNITVHVCCCWKEDVVVCHKLVDSSYLVCFISGVFSALCTDEHNLISITWAILMHSVFVPEATLLEQ